MANGEKAWETYEEVARFLLDEFASKFGLQRVEGKQQIKGAVTDWEIDAKGVAEEDGIFIIVECRRYTKSGLNQEALGGLAYRIRDTGAAGAIVVSPLPFQRGAQKIADATGVHSVRLNSEATREEYILEFLGEVAMGWVERFEVEEELSIEIRDKDGNLVERRRG